MKRQYVLRTLWGVFIFGFLRVVPAHVAYGQFIQNKKDTVTIDSSALPKSIQKGYRVFRGKCSECHSLDTSLRPSMSASQWTTEVKRMQAMASSQFNDDQAVAILSFLNYDETHRKSALKASVSVLPPTDSDSIGAGKEFYIAQGCAACHSIAGEGGALRSLDGVGSRLSPQELKHRMQVQPTGSAMPPLPPGTTALQIDHLVEFLGTLKAP